MHVGSKPLLVSLLDPSPLFPELGILSEGQETLKELEVLEPDLLVKFESLGDELGESGVAMVKPATRSD